MITSRELFGESQEEEFLKEQNYIMAEKHHQEMQIWQEIEEKGKYATILVGKPRKKRKFETHGKVRIAAKLPHFLKSVSHHNGRIPAGPNTRSSTGSDILSGMPF